MKYIVKNCPAVYIFKNGYSCNNLEFDEHKYCKDIPDCLIKQIAGLCEEKIKVCENCSKTADINIDCVECDEKGEANISRAIVNLLEIEEINDNKIN